MAVLIGERPGLTAPDSMGAYLTWQPGPHTTDADRNCISNIRPDGIGYADAAHKLAHLLRAMRARRISGVQLKDDSDRPRSALPSRHTDPGAAMKTSTDRILTTHTGSLPRPKPLMDLILGREKGDTIDAATFEAATAKAVDEVVAQQVTNGVDIVSDGEMSKPSYTTYIRHRVEGIEHDPRAAEKGRDIMIGRDLMAHPDFGAHAAEFLRLAVSRLRRAAELQGPQRARPRPRASEGRGGEIEARRRVHDRAVAGILTRFIINLHYPTEEAYVEALAEMMKTEYRAIVEAGFVLQIDAPTSAPAATTSTATSPTTNSATRSPSATSRRSTAPSKGCRPTGCGCTSAGATTKARTPSTCRCLKIIDIAFKARIQAISIEAANPRHDHEWEDLKTFKIPDDKILIPGVIDSTTNFVEHPKLVAQRIGRYADIVGRERVIAGVDCGFGTAVRTDPIVADSIVWAKLKALGEGAAIASERLWGSKAA